MLFSKYLGSFGYYNIILIFLFSITVNKIEYFSIINSISYTFFHFVIIYLGLYYYRKILYIIYFFYGLSIDLLLINQIGPHLLVFIILLIFFSQTKKFYLNLSSVMIYLIIVIIQIFMFFLEMILGYLLFNYNFDFYNYLNLILISVLISYPIFLIFSKLDNQN